MPFDFFTHFLFLNYLVAVPKSQLQIRLLLKHVLGLEADVDLLLALVPCIIVSIKLKLGLFALRQLLLSRAASIVLVFWVLVDCLKRLLRNVVDFVPVSAFDIPEVSAARFFEKSL